MRVYLVLLYFALFLLTRMSFALRRLAFQLERAEKAINSKMANVVRNHPAVVGLPLEEVPDVIFEEGVPLSELEEVPDGIFEEGVPLSELEAALNADPIDWNDPTYQQQYLLPNGEVDIDALLNG